MNEKQELDSLIGNNIRRERLRAGYTQDQFSELIGIGSKSLSAVERGQVGISLLTLRRICKVLSVSSNIILFESTPQNDVQAISECLKTLTPHQFSIAQKVFDNLMEAFSVDNT